MRRNFKSKKIKYKDLSKHETKRKVLIKFIFVLFLFAGYFFFIAHRYGTQDGFLVTMLTWSFFVLCTPVADAGFLIDFPFRMITKFRMIISETFVWVIAISLNIYVYYFNQGIYLKTSLLSLFKHILESPFPFWVIIFISLIGTFVSIQFGDELLDKVNHKERIFHQKNKHKFKFIIMIFLFILAFILYSFLLKGLDINLPI